MMGKIKYHNFDILILTESYLEFENLLSSSGILSQDLRHWRSSRRSRKICKIGTLNQKNLKIESSSCQCSNDIEWTKKGNSEQCVSNSEKVKMYAMKFSRTLNIPHPLALEKKRNDMKVTNIRLKENGFPPPRKWWNDSKKQVTLYSRVPVL